MSLGSATCNTQKSKTKCLEEVGRSTSQESIASIHRKRKERDIEFPTVNKVKNVYK